MRLLVRRILEETETWRVAREAASGADALERFRKLHPDVIVLDQGMLGMPGLQTAELILAEDPSQAIVLFTAVKDPAVLEQANEIASGAASSSRSSTI